MKLKEIIKTKAEIEKDGNFVENAMIRGADISVIGHFGNCVTFSFWTDNCTPYHDYNNTNNLGWIIKAFVELFDLTEEDGYCLSKIKDIPCRIITEGSGGWGSKVIGFGHFMKDQFVYKELESEKI